MALKLQVIRQLRKADKFLLVDSTKRFGEGKLAQINDIANRFGKKVSPVWKINLLLLARILI